MSLHDTVAVGLYAVAVALNYGYKVEKPIYKLRHSQHRECLTNQTQVLQDITWKMFGFAPHELCAMVSTGSPSPSLDKPHFLSSDFWL